jgi:selenide,water dikinase
MTQLNASAATSIRNAGIDVHACTDITGFGIIGHSTELAIASGCTVVLQVDAVPLLPGALDLVAQHTPGGGRTNRDYFEGSVGVESQLKSDRLQLLYDPQTSGGLLFAVPDASAAAALAALRAAGAGGWLVGAVEPRSTVAVSLR